jgi:hypothetical protein
MLNSPSIEQPFLNHFQLEINNPNYGDKLFTVDTLNGTVNLVGRMATDDKYLYIASGGGNNNIGKIARISLTNPNGDYNQSWLTMNYVPNGLLVVSGYIYVSVGTSTFIAKYNTSNINDRNEQWAKTEPYPQHLAFDGSKYIYVAAIEGIGRINITNPNDNNTKWATTLPNVGNLGIAVGGNYIYVSYCEKSDDPNYSFIARINISNPNDKIIKWVQTGYWPLSLFFYNDNIYVLQVYTSSIGKISVNSTYDNIIGDIRWRTNLGNFPMGILRDTSTQDKLFVSYRDNNTITKMIL